MGTNSKLADVLTRPRPSIHSASFFEMADAPSCNRLSFNFFYEYFLLCFLVEVPEEHRTQNLQVPTVTFTPADPTTTRIQTLRQKLFSAPLQYVNTTNVLHDRINFLLVSEIFHQQCNIRKKMTIFFQIVLCQHQKRMSLYYSMMILFEMIIRTFFLFISMFWNVKIREKREIQRM